MEIREFSMPQMSHFSLPEGSKVIAARWDEATKLWYVLVEENERCRTCGR